MSRWLIKSEPHVYAFSRLVADGKTSWEGVRNYEARNNLRAMKKGDLALYYHSNEGLAVVGVARVRRAAYADPTAPKDEEKKAWVAVDFEPVKAFSEPVTLATIKATPQLADILLVKRSRISVVPVTDAEFDLILKMGNTHV